MPYFRDPNLDQKDDQSNVQLSGGSQQAGDDGTVGDGGPKTKPTNSGSKFTNIDSYLQNGNAKQFGEEFGGKIQGSIDQAKSNFDTTAGNVKSQIDQSGYAPTQDEINSYVSNAGAGTTDEDAKKYQGWLNQSYGGPKSVADNSGAWNEYWNKANEASTAAKQSGTEGGRFALLDKYYGRPTYNFGQKALDNVLVQNGGGFNNASDLQNQASQLSAYGSQKDQEIRNAAAQKAAAIDQSKGAASTAVNSAMSDFQNNLDSRLTFANNDKDKLYSSLMEHLSNGNLSNDDLKYLNGLSGDTNTYGLDPTKYLSNGPALKRGDVATPEQTAQYNALTKLAGIENTYLKPNDKAEGNPSLLFDSARFNQDSNTEMNNLYNTYLSNSPAEMESFSKLDPKQKAQRLQEAANYLTETNQVGSGPLAEFIKKVNLHLSKGGSQAAPNRDNNAVGSNPKFTKVVG